MIKIKEILDQIILGNELIRAAPKPEGCLVTDLPEFAEKYKNGRDVSDLAKTIWMDTNKALIRNSILANALAGEKEVEIALCCDDEKSQYDDWNVELVNWLKFQEVKYRHGVSRVFDSSLPHTIIIELQ